MFDTRDNLYPLIEVLPVLIMLAVIGAGVVALCLLGRGDANTTSERI